jgi:hypothetical protein
MADRHILTPGGPSRPSTALTFLSGRLIPDPSLLYWVQLNTHEGPMVQVNTLGAEPLIIIQTGQNGVTVPLPERPQVSPGYVFTRTHHAEDPTSVSHVGISPLPTGFPRRFRLVADFYLPAVGDHLAEGDKWAAVVGIRSSDNPDVSGFHLAGATHQMRRLATDVTPDLPFVIDGRVVLGSGTGTTNQSPVDPTDLGVAYPGGQRQFTLETDIDLDLKRGWSRLKTPGKIFTEITWQFDATKFPPIAGVGFGQAYAMGLGSALVTATAFRIYRLEPHPTPPPVDDGTFRQP